jgi:hypothetical protein
MLLQAKIGICPVTHTLALCARGLECRRPARLEGGTRFGPAH